LTLVVPDARASRQAPTPDRGPLSRGYVLRATTGWEGLPQQRPRAVVCRNTLSVSSNCAPPASVGVTPWRLSCDFFTIETAWLQRLHVLFFIEIASRKVHLASITANRPASG